MNKLKLQGNTSLNHEGNKVQQHLSLLREQYVKLQEKCSDLERKLSMTSSFNNYESENTFHAKILNFVSSLYDKQEYSDIVIRMQNNTIHAHKFVLSARSDSWCGPPLADTNSLDWSDIEYEIGCTILKWVYTDLIQLKDYQATLLILKSAARFSLHNLVERCENWLLGVITVDNCVELYTIAEEISAHTLRNHCSMLISTHWDNFTGDDFANMTAPLLYSMLKSKTEFVLHTSVRLKREDVLFLYLVEFNSQLPGVLNKIDNNGRLALDMALEMHEMGICNTLLNHGVSVNSVDSDGLSILYLAVERGDLNGIKFLLKNGTNVNVVDTKFRRNSLLQIAGTVYKDLNVKSDMIEAARLLIDNEVDCNTQDMLGKTAVHLSVENRNYELLQILVNIPNIDLNLKDDRGLPPIWYALNHPAENFNTHTNNNSNNNCFSRLLCEHQVLLDEKLNNGDTLLHLACKAGLGKAGIFLAKELSEYFDNCDRESADSKGISGNCDRNSVLGRDFSVNHAGESVLHLSCTKGLPELTKILLEIGIDPNLRTLPLSPSNRNCLADNFNNVEISSNLGRNLTNIGSSMNFGSSSSIGKNTTNIGRITTNLGKNFNSEPENPFDFNDSGTEDHGSNEVILGSQENLMGSQNLLAFQNNLIESKDHSLGSQNQLTGSQNNLVESDEHFLRSQNHLMVPKGHLLGPRNHSENIFNETALHRALRYNNIKDAEILLIFFILEGNSTCDQSPKSNSYEEKFAKSYGQNSKFCEKSTGLLLDLQDSESLTVFGVALLMEHYEIAKKLLNLGANVNYTDADGRGLLHRVLLLQSEENYVEKVPTISKKFINNVPSTARGEYVVKMAKFLINNGADCNLKALDLKSPLDLCIENGLTDVVECLCLAGADIGSNTSENRESPLWASLDSGHPEIAKIFVKHGIDMDAWSPGPEGTSQTMLHKAIDENREDIACFLIENGCEINAVRQPLPGWRGTSLADDKQTPLHMCASWNLLHTARALLNKDATVNARDFEGKTPLHIALEIDQKELIETLLEAPTLDLTARDNKGLTPFSLAMKNKNNMAAKIILEKHSSVAEQYDAKGLNYLHSAIHKNDLESVLFLLSIHVSLSSRTKDDRGFTPLHLATVQGNEMIVRNLLLVGASINDLTPQKQTCLHLCAEHDRSNLASIFLQNNINIDALDCNLNNALHVAIKEGHLSTVRVLLTESNINASAINLRGQNPFHVLASYPKENAGALAQLFLDSMPEYPINEADVVGNTPLLLAYMRGSSQLCRVLVRAGASLGTANKQGVHLFNYGVATKALLKRLLDSVAVEPPWCEGDYCLECETKFGIATRKHHCRHCGRVLCNKCSIKDMPILKFDIKKPVRVCQTCFEVLTLGPNAP